MIATRGSNLQGEDFQGSSPIYVPVLIANSTAVRMADCLKGQLAQC